MTDPIRLATRPLVIDEVRESVTRLLREALEKAEAGKVDCVIIILGHPDGTWTDLASETVEFSKAVGRLEILKHKWIARFVEHDNVS